MSRFDHTAGDYRIDPPSADEEPCPFCNNTGVIVSEPDEQPYRVLTDCDCQGDGRPQTTEDPIHDAA